MHRQYKSSFRKARPPWLDNETACAVTALIAALRVKHSATADHALRVAVYTVAIGTQLRLNGVDLLLLRTAALLHDLGKIGVPDAILDKPSRLDARERHEIEQHPLLSEKIVGSLAIGEFIAPLVRGHHERWDGHGYPDGLKGTAIPLGARVIAVADAYDAMTSDRVYARSRSPLEALRELRIGAGSQWDPAVVTAIECEFALTYAADVLQSADVPSTADEPEQRRMTAETVSPLRAEHNAAP